MAQYQRELDELKATFESARRAANSDLQRASLGLAAGPAIFVGTGGTVALAQLAADLHIALSRQLAVTATPLEFLQSPPLDQGGALFFSARAKHPDAQLVLDRLSSGDFRPAVLVTHRDPADLPRLGPDVEALQLPAPRIREGFLATNSVLAMATHLVRAFGEEPGSDLLAGINDYVSPAVKSRPSLLVLYPPRLKAVAIDLETRCSELGVASVQTTDLRNFAHGRHTGLARRSAETSVLVLSDADSDPLASRVAEVVAAADAPMIRWHTDLSAGLACLRLLAASMWVVGKIADELGVDPARPRVPGFGRRLYNLPIKRILQRKPEGPVALKARALSAGHLDKPLTEIFQQAFDVWRLSCSKQRFGGVVVDYDGTVCATRERYELPTEKMQSAILRVLEGGLKFGFATGRGKSVHEDLRAWIPSHLWPSIYLGLYNGAVRLKLSEQLPDLHTPTDLMAEITERLDASPFSSLMSTEVRIGQVSVRAEADTFFHDLGLARLVRDLLDEDPAIDAKVVSSGHSVDVLAPDTTKVAVLKEVEASCGRPVLAFGDQGQSGGNDFELLASTPWSISVDRCSVDPTRCWSVGRVGRRGPAALEEVLKRLQIRNGSARLAIPAH